MNRQLCVRTRAEATKASSVKRAVVILPGLGNAGGDYAQLAAALNGRGLFVKAADVARIDWARNASGLRYAEYWRGTLSPRPTVDWYLERVAAAVEEAKRATDGAPVTLLAHSAGGWMGRVFMRDFGTTGIDRFVSLGSPHLPPPAGVIDQTRGILTWCSNEMPGAYHDAVSYVTVSGKYIRGAALSDSQATWAQKVAGAGYQQTCGKADVWGDAIVPVDIAHLEGSRQLSLGGCYHSPLGTSEARPWYGSAGMLEQWVWAVDGEEGLMGVGAGEEAQVV